MHQKLKNQEADADPAINKEKACVKENQRRSFLIDKEFAEGLTPVEKAELDELQARAAQRLEAVAPLPFDRLEAWERAVQEAIRVSQTASSDASEPS